MKAGEIIKRRREYLEMTQVELAEKANYTDRSTISRFESSDVISAKAANAISEALGIETKYLMEPHKYTLSDLINQGVLSEKTLTRKELMYLEFKEADKGAYKRLSNYAQALATKTDLELFIGNLTQIKKCLDNIEYIYKQDKNSELIKAYNDADEVTKKAINTLLKLDK